MEKDPIDTSKYKVWTMKHIYMLHWMINPAVAINELLLGQRVPRILFVEKDSKKRLPEKSFIPCPHCHTIHSSMKWTPQNKTAFGNWFGLYCDHCEKTIPCARNITAVAIEVITFPVWGWFRKSWRNKWLMKQKEKFSKPQVLAMPEYVWWKTGIEIGVGVYLLGIIWNLIEYGKFYNEESLLYSIIIGSICGYVMKGILGPSKPTVKKNMTAKQDA